MSKCIKCGRELTSGEIPEFNYGMCDKCYKGYQCEQYPFKKGIYDTQEEIQQLKQQLEEKDEQIKKRVMVYEEQFIEQTNEIYSLKQQLAEKDIRIEELEGQFAYECECNMQLVDLQKQLEEKQNTIDEINKEFVQSVKDWKALCAEKDKEIEKLKQQNTLLENENGKLAKELIVKNYKKAQKEVSFGTQLAIQELEKVKKWVADHTQDFWSCENDDLDTELYDFIDNQIKELN